MAIVAGGGEEELSRRDRGGDALDLADRHARAADAERRSSSAGWSFPRDEPVAAVIASANRESEARFERADEFDVGREKAAPAGDVRLRPPLLLRPRLRAPPRADRPARAARTARPGWSSIPGHEVPFSGWEFRAPRELRVRWVE